jgi:hypothetical protein
MGLGCVRIRVRKTFQNLLKSEKIRKCMENYILQIQTVEKFKEVRKPGGRY